MAWAASVVPYRARLAWEIRPRILIWRLIQVAAGGFGALWLLLWCGLDAMSATVTASLIVSLAVLWSRPRLCALGLSGLVGYSIFHFVEMKTWFLIWPHFLDYWSPAGSWNERLWGIPLGELVFTAVFGFSLPVLLGYYAEVILDRKAVDS